METQISGPNVTSKAFKEKAAFVVDKTQADGYDIEDVLTSSVGVADSNPIPGTAYLTIRQNAVFYKGPMRYAVDCAIIDYNPTNAIAHTRAAFGLPELNPPPPFHPAPTTPDLVGEKLPWGSRYYAITENVDITKPEFDLNQMPPKIVTERLADGSECFFKLVKIRDQRPGAVDMGGLHTTMSAPLSGASLSGGYMAVWMMVGADGF